MRLPVVFLCDHDRRNRFERVMQSSLKISIELCLWIARLLDFSAIKGLLRYRFDSVQALVGAPSWTDVLPRMHSLISPS